MSSRRDGPPRMTSIDRLIDQLGKRSTVAVSAIPRRLRAAKAKRVSSAERIEELVRENGDLVQEVIYFRSLTENSRFIAYEVRMAFNLLERCLQEFNAAIEEANKEWAKIYSVDGEAGTQFRRHASVRNGHGQ
ncbi:hypothetical protein NKR23_g9009 [Pleurostoma richardsiae]|uniref:Uncharacterized protein n=1 Tax=Pleurostoma richardsiae TaxID=41990 RepID=A0AA38R7P9_9PEZI|nr:hypothetical protein NKR23_g9009 [Pleurostoma richardsiae]